MKKQKLLLNYKYNNWFLTAKTQMGGGGGEASEWMRETKEREAIEKIYGNDTLWLS